jgi:hypothetical protein
MIRSTWVGLSLGCLGAWVGLFGCGVGVSTETPAAEVGETGETQRIDQCTGGEEAIFVVTSMRFTRVEAGIADGFDLDGIVTGPGESTGCGFVDYTSPEGVPGIDSAFASLVPALELTEAQAVEGLVQASINSGELLLLLRVDGLSESWDSSGIPADDPCVRVEVIRGYGEPGIDSDGRISAYQTFDRDPRRESSLVEGASLSNGHLVARPFDLQLPLNVLNAELNLAMRDSALRVDTDPTGAVSGIFGGGVELATILAVASEENVDPTLAGLIASLLTSTADLAPDSTGACQQISMGFTIEARPAFLYDEPLTLDGNDSGR